MLLVYFLQVLDGVIFLFWAGLVISMVLSILLSIGVIIQKDSVSNEEMCVTFIHEEEKTRMVEAQAQLEKGKPSISWQVIRLGVA